MPTFGRYEATRELEMTALGSVWAATLSGSSRAFIVKSYRPDPIVMRPEEVEQAVASFLERANLQRKTLAAGGQRWAPIHDVGRFPEGAYYVTDPYATSAEKLIGRGGKLDAYSIFAIIGGVVRGLMELKKTCGRPHGNLKAANVLMERAKPTAPPRVFLTDMADAGRVSEEGSEANDIDALGQLLFQLVMHRAWMGMDSWPIPPTEEWNVLGAKADKWRELCNLLLHPSPAQGLRRVDGLPRLITALKPKRRGSWLRKLAVFTILVVGGGAGGFFWLQARPDLARTLLTRLRVALNLQPRTPLPPATTVASNPSTTGPDQPATQRMQVDPLTPPDTHPSTRNVGDPTTRIAITTSHPSTTVPASRPVETVLTTQPVQTTRPSTQLVDASTTRSTTGATATGPTATGPTTVAVIGTSRPTTAVASTQVATTAPTTRAATQIATTQPTTRIATTQPATRVATTQPATRASTQVAATHPVTRVAATQASTRAIGPSTSVATTGPASRATTVASTRPATRDVRPAFDPAQVAALGQWTSGLARRGFGSTADAARTTLGGMERLKTQLAEMEKRGLAEAKGLLTSAARTMAGEAEQARVEGVRKAEMARRMEAARKAEEARIAEAARMAKETKAKTLREGLASLGTDLVVSPALKGAIAAAAKVKRGEMLEKIQSAVEGGTLDQIDAAYRTAVRREYDQWIHGELQKRAAELLAGARETASGIDDSPAKVSALAEVAVEQQAAGRPADARATIAAARKVAGSLNKATRSSVYRDLARPMAAVGEAPAAKAMAGTIPRAAWKAEALRDIAAVEARAGRFDDALATAASIAEPREQAEGYGLVAASQAAAGDSAAARASVAKIPKAYDRIGAYLNVADAEASLKRIPAARASLNEARKLVSQIDDPDFRVRALRWVIGAEARLGNVARAKTEAKSLTDAHEKALAYQSIGAAQVTAGDLAAALQSLGDAEVAASAVRDARERDDVLREIAVTQADAGNPSMARRTAGGIRDAAAQGVVNRAIALAQARAGDMAAASKTIALMGDTTEKAIAFRAVAEEQAKRGDDDKAAAFVATITNPYQKSFAQVGSARAWIKLANEVAPVKE